MPQTEPTKLSAEQANTLLKERGAILVDIRETDEVARTSVDGAHHHPMSQIGPEILAQFKDRDVILLCASGARATQFASHAGDHHDRIFVVEGGLAAWAKAGNPVQTNTKAPLPIMRQVQITAGSLVFLGTVLGFFVHPGFYGLSAFVGAGLVFAGVSGTCGMATVLGMMPWNKMAQSGTSPVEPKAA